MGCTQANKKEQNSKNMKELIRAQQLWLKKNKARKRARQHAAQSKSAANDHINDNLNFPQECYCPLSLELMQDPVITADGHTYERKEIQKWFEAGNDTSPLTNLKMESKALIPNIALRNMILKTKQENKPYLICAVCQNQYSPKEDKESIGICKKCRKQQENISETFNL